MLTLVTNSLKVDLSSSNQYIQALSLVAIGNLATADMARDLSTDVERILRGSSSYLKKKAALACIRLIKKVRPRPEHTHTSNPPPHTHTHTHTHTQTNTFTSAMRDPH